MKKNAVNYIAKYRPKKTRQSYSVLESVCLVSRDVKDLIACYFIIHMHDSINVSGNQPFRHYGLALGSDGWKEERKKRKVQVNQ